MFARTPLLTACSLALALGCTTTGSSTKVAMTDGVEPGGTLKDGSGLPPRERKPVVTVDVSGTLTNPGDMLDAASKLVNQWDPPEPGASPMDLRDTAQILLMQDGFGPGFLEGIDLDGAHAFELAYPHENQEHATAGDVVFNGALSTIDAKRVIESMPAMAQPQAIGDNLWQVVEDDLSLFLRGQAKSLEISTSVEGLDQSSAKLLANVPADPRLRVRASNIPAGSIDPSDLLPLPAINTKLIASVMNEISAVEVALDFGSDRDLFIAGEIEAPIERLNLPLLPVVKDAGALTKLLPAGASVATHGPWKTPGNLRDMVQDAKRELGEIPAPFGVHVDAAIEGAISLVEHIDGEVAAGVYLDSKNRLSLVMVGTVPDEAGALKASRKIWGALEGAIKEHITLAGGSPEFKYKVGFKPEGIKLSKAKGDHFFVTLPKALDELLNAKFMFGSSRVPQLDIITVVEDGKLIVAIGAGAKDISSTIIRRMGKASGEGLETGGGLALARKLTDGCQMCMAIDPLEVMRLGFTVATQMGEEPAMIKAAKNALKTLKTIKLDGQLALGARFEAERAAVGFGVPKDLLFTDPKQVRKIIELVEKFEEQSDPPTPKPVAASVARP